MGVPSGSLAPGGAHVVEHRGADVEQLERVPVGEEALLGGEQPAALARLVAQWIAAQSVVAAEQDLLVGIEVVRRVADRSRNSTRRGDWRK